MSVMSRYLLIALILTGCGRVLERRVGDDYFPIMKPGAYWIYSNTEGDTMRMKVEGTTYVGGCEASIVDRFGNLEYWWQNDRYTERYWQHIVIYDGTPYEVAGKWVPFLRYPLVANDVITGEASNSGEIGGEPYRWQLTWNIKVGECKNMMTFDDVFTVEYEFIETFSWRNVADTCVYRFARSYAPNVGIVREIVGDDTLRLIEYSIP